MVSALEKKKKAWKEAKKVWKDLKYVPSTLVAVTGDKWNLTKSRPTTDINWRDKVDASVPKNLIGGPMTDASVYPDGSGRPTGLQDANIHFPPPLYGGFQHVPAPLGLTLERTSTTSRTSRITTAQGWDGSH